jgi:RNA polymerase sigma-70 factor (ECF subfamily)
VRRRREQPAELQRLYREQVGAVYAFFAYAVPRATAEDLTASTFERVVRAWGSFDPARASARTWIMSIARNLLADHFRRQQHRNSISLDQHPLLLETLRDAHDPFQQTLDRDEVDGWLNGLSGRERELIALRYGADLATSDIAALVGLTTANVQQILSRTLRRVRARAAREAEPLEANRSA